MFKKIVIIALILITITGCFSKNKFVTTKRVLTGIDTLTVPEGFDFKMTKSVYLEFSDIKMSGASINIYEKYGNQKGTLLEKGSFGKNGIYLSRLNMRNNINKLIVESDRLSDLFEAEIKDGKATIFSFPNIKRGSEGFSNLGETSIRKQFYPGEGSFGTLIFEDKWPKKGDYDCNDMVIDYNYSISSTINENGEEEIAEINATFVPVAAGANYINGFGFVVDINKELIESVSGQTYLNSITRDYRGLEEEQSKAVVIVFDNAKNIFGGNQSDSQLKMYNTNKAEPFISARPIEIKIKFLPGTKINQLKNSTPFNPFIFRNDNRGIEVHLKNGEPTKKASQNFFNTEDDRSNTKGENYSTANGLPWALDFPVTFRCPIEKCDISEAYDDFKTWVESGGVSAIDWYNISEGKNNYNLDKIYTREESLLLDMPTNLRAIEKSGTTVKIVWDKVEKAEKYKIYVGDSSRESTKRLVDKSLTFEYIGETDKTDFIVNNLTHGRGYFFAVTACREKVESQYSDEVNILTLMNGATNFEVVASASDHITLKWYNDWNTQSVFRSEDNKEFVNIGDCPIWEIESNGEFVDKNVVSGKTYFYKLKAMNESNYGRESEWSETVRLGTYAEKIEISTDKSKIIADNNDCAILTAKVLDGFGNEFRDNVVFNINGVDVEGNRFSTGLKGVNKIFAKVGGKISNEIEIEGFVPTVTVGNVVAAVSDSNVEVVISARDFVQKISGLEVTLGFDSGLVEIEESSDVFTLIGNGIKGNKIVKATADGEFCIAMVFYDSVCVDGDVMRIKFKLKKKSGICDLKLKDVKIADESGEKFIGCYEGKDGRINVGQ